MGSRALRLGRARGPNTRTLGLEQTGSACKVAAWEIVNLGIYHLGIYHREIATWGK